MDKKPLEIFLEDWEKISGPGVFVTVDVDNKPNAVYVGCFRLSGNKIVIANNKFYKTQENVLSGSYGSFLFITKQGKSYQLKGPLENHTEGEVFDEMKGWLDSKYPGYSAVTLLIKEIYSGREKVL